jgi:hypothetical protein
VLVANPFCVLHAVQVNDMPLEALINKFCADYSQESKIYTLNKLIELLQNSALDFCQVGVVHRFCLH